MAGKKTIEVSVLNQGGVLYQGHCQVVFVPTANGEVAILPEHTPLILLLTVGEVSIVSEGNRQSISQVTNGVVYVGENKASVLVNNDQQS